MVVVLPNGLSSPAAGLNPGLFSAVRRLPSLVVRPSLRSGQAPRTQPAVILSEDEGERWLGGRFLRMHFNLLNGFFCNLGNRFATKTEICIIILQFNNSI